MTIAGCVALVTLASLMALALGIGIGRSWGPHESFEDIVDDCDAALDRIDSRLHQSPSENKYVTALWVNDGTVTYARHPTRIEAIDHICDVVEAVYAKGPYCVSLRIHGQLGIFGTWYGPDSNWKWGETWELRKQLWALDLGDGIHYTGQRDYDRT